MYSSTCCFVRISPQVVVNSPKFDLRYLRYLYSSTSISEPRLRRSIRKPKLCVVLATQLLLFLILSFNSSAILLLNAINRHFWVFGINCIEATAVEVLPLPAKASITALPTPCSTQSKNFS